MININVFSNKNVDIEQKEFHIETQEDMIDFIHYLLDKAYYAGESLCLEKATIINDNEGLIPEVIYETIERW